ncbi:hypothetical protein ACU8V3_01305 [Cobetia marina]
MVSGNDVDATIHHGGTQGGTVFGGLHGRVALDQAATRVVIGIAEPQVMRADLGGDLLASHRARLEQRHLFSGGQVQDVQLGAVASGQVDRQA